MFDLRGKVCLVTGGNGGIGLGFARGFAKGGASVVIWGRNAEKNATAAEELRQHGVEVHAAEIDVSSEDQVVAGMADAVARFGRLDCAFANAGAFGRADGFVNLTSEMWRALIDVSLHGAFYTLREAARHMVQRSEAGDTGGSLIGCGSLSIFRGVPGMEHYGAAKGGLSAMIHGIALELGKYGIRANTVAPGRIRVDTEDRELTEKEQRFVNHTPIPRLGYPEDFEGIANYLASDVSAFHTGDIITIDGGFMRSLT